ncbi:MAG: site-specific DNA-methyltransferase [Sorangiineae bacterium]|nr:site-specific DNA-methyltransferase [Polyangiaceae bacterium]MEB2322450.1 site-specific DNA-methyltransferase [Sorangiineae bacterium]
MGSPRTRPRAALEAPAGSEPGALARERAARPPRAAAGRVEIIEGDNLPVLRDFPDASFGLIYIDPPFNTGRARAHTQIETSRDERGDRVGYQGKRYRTTVLGRRAYRDSFEDYLGFLTPRLEEAFRVLEPTGSLFLHLDYREVHYAKVLLDRIFGRECFINEIIWAYDYGARATRRWSPKHDNILFYAKDPRRYCFNYDAIDRIPYLAPSLVTPEKAARGKTPTDTWWHTIVSPTGKEKTGYPTQKPLGILDRIVRVHSRPGDRVLDCFAGSGSFGEAAARLGRDAVLIDESADAIAIMKRRLASWERPAGARDAGGAASPEVGKDQARS